MSRYRSTFRVALLALLAGAVGCSRHYHDSIEAYRSDEGTSYLTRTLDWTTEAETLDEAAGVPDTPEPPVRIQSEPRSSDEPDAWRKGLIDLFGLDPESIDETLARLSDPEKLDEALARESRWDDLRLAAAIANPGVQAARERWEATVHQYDQAAYLDGLIAQYRTFTRYLQVGAGKPLHRQATKAIWPYPGTIALKGEMIREQVRLAELEWLRAVRDTVIRTGEAFFGFQYHRQAEQTTSNNIDLLVSLLEVSEERYRTGQTSQADVLKLQNELARQRDLLLDHESEGRTTSARINSLLGRPEGAQLAAPGSFNLPADAVSHGTLYEEALQRRQEIELARTKVARSEAAIRMGEIMSRPQASRGFSRLERGMMPEASEGRSRAPFGARAKAMPMPAFGQTEAYLTEMRGRLQGLRAELDQALAETDALARHAVERLDETTRQVNLIEREVLPTVVSIYETLRSEYIGGQAGFLDLLDAERELIDTRLELHRAHRDLNVAVLHLALVRGSFRGSEESLAN